MDNTLHQSTFYITQCGTVSVLDDATSSLRLIAKAPEVTGGRHETTRLGSATVVNHPWLASVGAVQASHKSDVQTHLDRALEHLEAARLIPSLKEAWDEHEALMRANQERMEMQYRETAFLSSPAALSALKRVNRGRGADFKSWHEYALAMGVPGVDTVRFAEDWIRYVEEASERDFLWSNEAIDALAYANGQRGLNHQTWQEWFDEAGGYPTARMCVEFWLGEHRQHVKAENAVKTAYRIRRRDELALHLVRSADVLFIDLIKSLKAAIDLIIDREIEAGMRL